VRGGIGGHRGASLCHWNPVPRPSPRHPPNHKGMTLRLGLKIDVDTWEGLKTGVPALAEILATRGVKASFFVALGPDNSGRAVLRVFRQRGFLAKMLRTRAPSVYGWRTILSGTFLPAPHLGDLALKILPSLAAAGHEVGVHGYDHVRWHDRLLKMNQEEVEREVGAACRVFQAALGIPPRAFAAPGWQASRVSREVLARYGFFYASDTRGTGPYYPRCGAWTGSVLEIPTTLPTLDELLGFEGLTGEEFVALVLGRLTPHRPQVLTLHAELEGGPYGWVLEQLLDQGLARGVRFFRLGDWAGELVHNHHKIPEAPVYQGRLPGRAGTVSRQGAGEESA
jgi:undecaprenyl phosphate-alpha-L-ara4FN deformylase